MAELESQHRARKDLDAVGKLDQLTVKTSKRQSTKLLTGRTSRSDGGEDSPAQFPRRSFTDRDSYSESHASSRVDRPIEILEALRVPSHKMAHSSVGSECTDGEMDEDEDSVCNGCGDICAECLKCAQCFLFLCEVCRKKDGVCRAGDKHVFFGLEGSWASYDAPSSSSSNGNLAEASSRGGVVHKGSLLGQSRGEALTPAKGGMYLMKGTCPIYSDYISFVLRRAEIKEAENDGRAAFHIYCELLRDYPGNIVALLALKALILENPESMGSEPPLVPGMYILDVISSRLEDVHLATVKEKIAAKTWLVNWQERGSTLGAVRLARYLDAMEEEYKEAVKYLRIAAEKEGDPGYKDALFLLGAAYSYGDGVTQNYSEAAAWYFRASKTSHIAAHHNLALRYLEGQGMEKNLQKAFDLFSQAADNKYADSQYRLSLCYKDGIGCVANEEKYLFWLKKAADNCLCEAQTDWGLHLKNDLHKFETAMIFFKLAADQGHDVAMYQLAVITKNGDGVEQDWPLAVEWFKKAAAKGHVNAMNSLGVCYSTGLGVKRDREEAFNYYKKAAEAGHVKGMFNLAEVYRTGRGAPENLIEAVVWYRKAAEEGHADAQFELGRCYNAGKGVKKDRKQAKEWISKAAAQDHMGAIEVLDSADAECIVM